MTYPKFNQSLETDTDLLNLRFVHLFDRFVMKDPRIIHYLRYARPFLEVFVQHFEDKLLDLFGPALPDFFLKNHRLFQCFVDDFFISLSHKRSAA